MMIYVLKKCNNEIKWWQKNEIDIINITNLPCNNGYMTIFYISEQNWLSNSFCICCFSFLALIPTSDYWRKKKMLILLGHLFYELNFSCHGLCFELFCWFGDDTLLLLLYHCFYHLELDLKVPYDFLSESEDESYLEVLLPPPQDPSCEIYEARYIIINFVIIHNHWYCLGRYWWKRHERR